MRFVKLSHFVILAVMVAAMFLMPANTSVSQASSEPGKVYLKHYNQFGSWAGLHQIDEELKWELTKAILDKGGLPTEENIDCLLHYPRPCP
ncbi:MAG: hypothetical protein KF753_11980 [Caldilineaceae bacterium]|nr:hypothetical protein [Caldilineaceae bacterium]